MHDGNDTWSGEEKPTGRLRLKETASGLLLQQEWQITTIGLRVSFEWREVPRVPADAPDNATK